MKMLDHWLPGDDFGAPLACLATSFTFDVDFFTEDCLSRFLSISTRDPDGASGLDLAGMLEEEERLAETTVCVLVDQSCRPQPRNLRWDLLPVRVPGGLLHAKVVVLLWERTARVIIGSANLTAPGYRNQVELGLAFDLDASCRLPRKVFEDLSKELRSLLDLTQGDESRPGPKARAHSVLDLFDRRIREVNPPEDPPRGVKVALAPARKGTNPLDMLELVWSGTPPQSVVALSPFWDGKVPMAGVDDVLDRLAKRAPTGERTSATFVVPVDSMSGSVVVRAPEYLRTVAPSRIESAVVAFKAGDDRRVHAKCVQYRSSTWLATMFGSSNLTAKGLGIDATPHREINLWIGCRADDAYAKVLENLIPIGETLEDVESWETLEDDEDETPFESLPPGFGVALLTSRSTLELGFTGSSLPTAWTVEFVSPNRTRTVLLDDHDWELAGRPTSVVVRLPDSDVLPSVLDVHWTQSGEQHGAAWLVNLGDGTFLPPSNELWDLSTDVLLTILASTRPLRVAIENAILRGGAQHSSKDVELDPLKAFDSSELLLQRTRRSSAALWGIERRLSKPVHSLEALEWRLAGVLGPKHLAEKIVEAARLPGALPGEAQFLLAELALTVHRIEWNAIRGEVPLRSITKLVKHVIDEIRTQITVLGDLGSKDAVMAYVHAVLSEVTR